jgi:hypothetical protein
VVAHTSTFDTAKRGWSIIRCSGCQHQTNRRTKHRHGVGREMPLVKKEHTDAKIDIESSDNRKQLFDEIIKSYEQINQSYDKFYCEGIPNECLITGKSSMHRLDIHYKMEVVNKYEILYDTSIEKLAKLITDFMQAWVLVKKMQNTS